MNSNGNAFYHNNFMAQLTVQASGKNMWDNGTVGNYWSDYLEKCPNASEIDSSGLWNIAYPIDINNTDLFPLVKPWPTVPGHCVAVISVVPTKTVIGQGMNCSLTVTGADYGEYAEPLNVSAYANNTAISPPQLSDLDTSCSTILTFTWNTTGLAYGNYMVSAYAQPVKNQTDVSGNNFTLGMLKVTIPGDINGDGKDNLTDLVLFALAYGSKPGDPNWNPNADIKGDGIVDLYDLYYLAKNYNLATTG
jgi:hypothetical protein